MALLRRDARPCAQAEWDDGVVKLPAPTRLLVSQPVLTGPTLRQPTALKSRSRPSYRSTGTGFGTRGEPNAGASLSRITTPVSLPNGPAAQGDP